MSTGDTVYASTDNLYVATQNWDWRWGGPVPLPSRCDATTGAARRRRREHEPGPPPTLIHQFRLDGGTEATYVASGQVEGRLLNQFAMSEHNGDLRVATTTDDWGGFGDQSESTVFVLRPNGDELEQISSIGGLGKGEQIYAVRFIGDAGLRGHVPPDRSALRARPVRPGQPGARGGELKIPGYSAYLHPVGDGLLLGVGQDATDEGRTTGTQLSLFDVSDPTNPQRIDTLPIGGQSEVEWDHKAFLFWQPDGTIVLPVSPGWGDCGAGVDCLAEDLDEPAAAPWSPSSTAASCRPGARSAIRRRPLRLLEPAAAIDRHRRRTGHDRPRPGAVLRPPDPRPPRLRLVGRPRAVRLLLVRVTRIVCVVSPVTRLTGNATQTENQERFWMLAHSSRRPTVRWKSNGRSGSAAK